MLKTANVVNFFTIITGKETPFTGTKTAGGWGGVTALGVANTTECPADSSMPSAIALKREAVSCNALVKAGCWRMGKGIKIIIADNHRNLCHMLQRYLKGQEDLILVALLITAWKT